MLKYKKYILYTLILLGIVVFASCSEASNKVSTTPMATPTNGTPTCTATSTPTPTYIVAPTFTPSPTEIPKKVICIDPGHQLKGNKDQEPIGPGSETTKDKVSTGTRGVSTKVYEYELTLTVSLLLKDELESRGYTVVMTRTTHDVDISNIERAQIATDCSADAFVRVHANAVSNKPSIKGVETLCMSKKNTYNPELYPQSRLLAQCLLDSILSRTDAENRGVYENDKMSGINWSTVPVSIIEMGYMSNSEEDKLLNTPEYQEKIVQGIADGIDLYFMELENQG